MALAFGVTDAAVRGPALGILEVSTISRGIVVADAGLKRAPAVLLHSRAISGGKHLVMFEGGVAEVEEAMAAAKLVAGDQLLDVVELSNADDQVWPLLEAPVTRAWDPSAEAVAIIETKTVCAAIAAVDASVKVADVVVRDTRFAVDLAGKAYFTITGTLDSIEAAVSAARAAADQQVVNIETIAQPAPELAGMLFR
ncbi:MAG TPA: BMC domain-containing protein [Kofleriaceae bacterium]